MGVELDSRYQVEAYEAIKAGIKEKNSAGIVLPTGTGKTYLALKLIEDNLNKKQILYVSPSPTVNVEIKKSITEIYSKEEAKQILSKIKFTTYNGLYKRYSTQIEDMQEYNSDIIIFDEIHRSGAEKWKNAVNYLLENNKNASVLGMTATPIRNDGHNMIEERCESADYELKISEAVARGILKLPTYISARHIFAEDVESMQEKILKVYDEKTRKELQKKLDKIKKQVENASGLKEIYNKYLKSNGRYLIFCNPGDNIEELQEKAKKEGIFDDINKKQKHLTVEANKKCKENDVALRKFCEKRGDELRLLYSKNMLNEGIHNENITGEIMLRPTKSYIVFVQQIGRVLRRDNSNEVLVLDLVGNIKYFKEFRMEIQKIIERENLKGKRSYDPKVLESFKIIEEQEDFIKSFEEIENQLENVNTIEKFIGKIKKLKELGVDVSKIKQKDTIETLIKRSEVEGERLEAAGLLLDDKIGSTKNGIAYSYRNRDNSKKIRFAPPTEEQVKRLKELGVSLEIQEKQNTVQVFIDNIKKLKELGVNVEEIRQKDTVALLAQEHKIGVKELEAVGLNPEYKIGTVKTGIAYSYRNRNNTDKKIWTPPTTVQLDELAKLGISLELQEKNNAAQNFINNLNKLQELGADVTQIKRNDSIKDFAKRYGIEIEELKIAGLEPNVKIGSSKSGVIQAYRNGKSEDGSANLTDKQVQELRKLGIHLDAPEKQNTVQVFIDKLKKMQELGIDVSKIKERDTIGDLAKRFGIGEEELKAVGLKSDNAIGRSKNKIAMAYRKKEENKTRNLLPPTKEQMKELTKLGISLEMTEKQNTVQIFIENLKKLQGLGVDITQIKKGDTIESLAKRQGVKIEELTQNGLEPNIKIASRRDTIIRAYRNKSENKKKYIPPTEKEVQELLELGIPLKTQEKESAVQTLINNFKKLKELGVDVEQLSKKDTIQTLAMKSGVGVEKIIAAGLNPEIKIGVGKLNLAQAYKNKDNKKVRYIQPTDAQIKELKDLGINLELNSKKTTGQEIGQATFDAKIEECDKAQKVINDLIEKQGEIKK